MNTHAEKTDELTLVDFLKSEDPDLLAKTATFTQFLDAWKSEGTYSYHRMLTSACSSTVTVHDQACGTDKELIMLASNNYLGLNMRPEVLSAMKDAVDRYGSGMSGSRFLSGTYDLVVQLEKELADFEGREEVMVFTTGYQANVGTITALMRAGDMVFIDRLSHASIVDGCRMAECEFRTFKHNDPASLEKLLARYAGKCRGKLVVVDGVFSMDGDLAKLPEIVRVARKYGARIMVDEAHGTGVLGKNGRGTVEHFGLEDQVDVIIGTFSKTFVAVGGYIAGSHDLVTYVRHYGRSYMFSASPVPATIAGVLAGLRIVRKEPELREKLWNNVQYFYNGLKSAGFVVFPDPPESAVITIPVGKDSVIRAMSKDLYDNGLFTSSVVYPAVAPNHGRLRISLSAAHMRDELDQALDVLTTFGGKHGVIKGEKYESASYSAVAVG